MKKYSKLILICLILFFVCCSNGSDIVVERISGESRGIEETTDKEEIKDIYSIIPSLFSIGSGSQNPFMPSRFISGKIETSLFRFNKSHFWEIPELMKPFVYSMVKKKEKTEKEDIETPIIYEIASYSLLQSRNEISYKGVITLGTFNSASLSYSLDKECFEEYREPIEITDPSVITVKAKANDNSKHFLSTSFSYSIEELP